MQGMDQINDMIGAVLEFFNGAYEKGWLLYFLIGLVLIGAYLIIK